LNQESSSFSWKAVKELEKKENARYNINITIIYNNFLELFKKGIFMYNKKTLEDIDVFGKKVIVRCDFNVPFDSEGKISDPKRINESLKTIKYLINKNAKIILCSHLGRPKGEVNLKFSLKPVAEYLTEILNQEVKLVNILEAKKINLQEKQVILLENLRFDKREELNDPEFSKELASLAEIYVNDAFGTAHRAHASTTGIAKYLPAVCGYLIQKELSVVNKFLENPKRPFISILGGAKVSDKIEVINNLLKKIDILIIGGGMAYTFLSAMGYPIGTSICEPDKIPLALDIMAKAKEESVKFLIPLDVKVGMEYSPNTEYKTVSSDSIPEGFMGLDIGKKTQEFFSETIKGAGTVVWNGPMGVSEWENFAEGTNAIAKALAESGAITIIGGGDSAAAIEKLGFSDKMTHISTGGGAFLMLLGGEELPSIAALN